MAKRARSRTRAYRTRGRRAGARAAALSPEKPRRGRLLPVLLFLAADREASEKRRDDFEKRLAADREASERQRANFEKQIIRLTEQQGTLVGLVESLRHPQPATAGSNGPPG